MKILQTSTFKKVAKKLHPNQKTYLDDAVQDLLANPEIGIEKIGDLAGVRVHKFTLLDHIILLAYQYDQSSDTLILLALGHHENFYRDLKKSLK